MTTLYGLWPERILLSLKGCSTEEEEEEEVTMKVSNHTPNNFVSYLMGTGGSFPGAKVAGA
jgi:hypothetical protein